MKPDVAMADVGVITLVGIVVDVGISLLELEVDAVLWLEDVDSVLELVSAL